ncbi:MAG: hypothetical protein HYV07_23595 [Deltaproteobacteria bacterium]|nr:hypothetical protein [Deltaproteobacteria bacterium]
MRCGPSSVVLAACLLACMPPELDRPILGNDVGGAGALIVRAGGQSIVRLSDRLDDLESLAVGGDVDAVFVQLRGPLEEVCLTAGTIVPTARRGEAESLIDVFQGAAAEVLVLTSEGTWTTAATLPSWLSELHVARPDCRPPCAARALRPPDPLPEAQAQARISALIPRPERHEALVVDQQTHILTLTASKLHDDGALAPATVGFADPRGDVWMASYAGLRLRRGAGVDRGFESQFAMGIETPPNVGAADVTGGLVDGRLEIFIGLNDGRLLSWTEGSTVAKLLVADNPACRRPGGLPSCTHRSLAWVGPGEVLVADQEEGFFRVADGQRKQDSFPEGWSSQRVYSVTTDPNGAALIAIGSAEPTELARWCLARATGDRWVCGDEFSDSHPTAEAMVAIDERIVWGTNRETVAVLEPDGSTCESDIGTGSVRRLVAVGTDAVAIAGFDDNKRTFLQWISLSP